MNCPSELNRMKYEIEPLRRAGPFVFGMSPTEVRRTAGSEFRSFKRTASSAHPCDHFPSLGVVANYTPDGRLEAIEFAAPALPLLHDQSLRELSLINLKNFLSKHDDTLEAEIESVLSRDLGVSGWAPSAKDDGSAPCESILVCVKGYYD